MTWSIIITLSRTLSVCVLCWPPVNICRHSSLCELAMSLWNAVICTPLPNCLTIISICAELCASGSFALTINGFVIIGLIKLLRWCTLIKRQSGLQTSYSVFFLEEKHNDSSKLKFFPKIKYDNEWVGKNKWHQRNLQIHSMTEL